MMADLGELALLFDAVLHAVDSGHGARAIETLGVFERRLDAHLRLEAQQVLSRLDARFPDEVAHLASEQRALRGALRELGGDVDRLLNRAPWVTSFVARLRAYATREDALLERWIDGALAVRRRGETTTSQQVADAPPALRHGRRTPSSP